MSKFFEQLGKYLKKSEPKLRTKINKVTDKGHERITVLLIPHGYDSSINFQVSLFTILFFILLLGSIMGISIYGIFKSSGTQKQISDLSKTYGAFFEQYVQFSDNLEELEETFSKIQEDLFEVYSLTDSEPGELNALPSLDDVKANSENEIVVERNSDKELLYGKDYLREIYRYRNLRNSLLANQKLLSTSIGYYTQLIESREKIPLGQPIPFPTFTSEFGMRKSPTTGTWELHDGVDIAGGVGTPIYAPAPGRVVKVSYSPIGYGNHLMIQHGYGYITLFGHCSKIFVKPGAEVSAGQLIAHVGATGNVTGPHLHYEVWNNDGTKFDPDEFLAWEN